MSREGTFLKILSVIGARPQFIKAAALSRELLARPGVRGVLVHTGQHFDPNMSNVFFEELEIPRPDYNLGIQSGNHGAQTGRMLEKVEEVLQEERPDWVLVYGDTNSTLAGALAAAKLNIPVAHIEAGLRSFNRRMPEEINRILADHVSDLLFAPTETAVKNLEKEGITGNKVRLVGDVMFDAALFYGGKAEKESRVLETLGLTRGDYVLATIHRAENTDDPQRLATIFEGLSLVASSEKVILPLHPRTRKALENHGLFPLAQNRLFLIDPVGYLDMIMLEKKARVIATDSGGIQKEAFFCGVPCVTLRDETEWVELVDLGWNRLVPPLSPTAICDAVSEAGKGLVAAVSPYGEGDSSVKICSALLGK